MSKAKLKKGKRVSRKHAKLIADLYGAQERSAQLVRDEGHLRSTIEGYKATIARLREEIKGGKADREANMNRLWQERQDHDNGRQDSEEKLACFAETLSAAIMPAERQTLIALFEKLLGFTFPANKPE